MLELAINKANAVPRNKTYNFNRLVYIILLPGKVETAESLLQLKKSQTCVPDLAVSITSVSAVAYPVTLDFTVESSLAHAKRPGSLIDLIAMSSHRGLNCLPF